MVDSDNPILNELSILQTQFDDLGREQRLNLITFEVANRMKSKLQMALLQIYDIVVQKNNVRYDFEGLWAVMKFNEKTFDYGIEDKSTSIEVIHIQQKEILRVNIRPMGLDQLDGEQYGDLLFDTFHPNVGKLFLRTTYYGGCFPIQEFSFLIEDTIYFKPSKIIKILENGKEKYILCKPDDEEKFKQYIKEQFEKSLPPPEHMTRISDIDLGEEHHKLWAKITNAQKTDAKL